MSSRKRYLQYLAAQRFYEEATGDFGFYQEDAHAFTEAELREEAAFRCWLREIDIHDCPLMLPSNAALRGMADAWDWLYGPLTWWSWPVLSTCQRRVCPFHGFSMHLKNIKHHLDGNICLREVTIVAWYISLNKCDT